MKVTEVYEKSMVKEFETVTKTGILDLFKSPPISFAFLGEKKKDL